MTAHPELSRLTDRGLFRERAYIGGEWRAAASDRTFDVSDPATGTVVGRVPALGPTDAAAAVAAAHDAFPAWRAALPQERARHLRSWFEAMRAAREDLAVLMTLEQGKPLAEAQGEIDYAASFVEWYAEEAKRLNVESVTGHLPGADMILRREPLGVAALVTPWNFPSAMITRKATAALAAGCTVVVHPSSETPFSALALAVVAERAGLPPGVFNTVTGEPGPIVAEFCRSPDVRALSFTGSTEIGRMLAAEAGRGLKRIVMELGGHAPFIVFADADLDKAVESAIAAKFATSGQDCLAANRLYVERPVFDAFAEAFTARARGLKVGAGFEPGVEIGPLMNARAVEKARRHVENALASGARLMTGGKPHSLGGLFFEPTVLSHVPDKALIMREETFGPVAALAPFEGEAEAIRRANATEYGLVAYLHTRDYGRISRLSRALEYGMVAVNRAKITGAPIPFGGMKLSGLGREGSRHGMEAFMEIKYVCLDAA